MKKILFILISFSNFAINAVPIATRPIKFVPWVTNRTRTFPKATPAYFITSPNLKFIAIGTQQGVLFFPNIELFQSAGIKEFKGLSWTDKGLEIEYPSGEKRIIDNKSLKQLKIDGISNRDLVSYSFKN